ncbi:MAG: hypothetical protein Q9174_003975 [Haloplaca sp. 1 TL-2023]
MTCRGSEISKESLYDYTNGRFLYDETRQLTKRYLQFDLTKLCDEASRVTNGSAVQSIEKMEGGFSKALLMTMSNGKEIIAKLPCPNAGRAMYSTASEAAVLQYRLCCVPYSEVPDQYPDSSTNTKAAVLECRRGWSSWG